MSRNEISRDDNEASKNELLKDGNEMSKLEMGIKTTSVEESNKGTLALVYSSPYTVTLMQKVPWYIGSQVVGSIFASGCLALLFDVDKKSYFGTLPVGSNTQSLVIEIIISFLLMLVICGVAIDDRGIGNFAGVVVGMTIMLNVLVAGPISGASMNPARSLGPAIIMREFRSIWVYNVGPIVGTIAGAFVYNLLTFTNKPLSQLLLFQLLPEFKLCA